MRILFVCSGNTYRSPVAEALLKKIYPGIEVDSAGVNPVIPISEAAKKYLKRENAQTYLKNAPEGLAGKKLTDYNLIVAMKLEHKEAILNKCPQCADRIVLWNIDDPYFLPFGYTQKIFDQLRKKVEELVNTLKSQKHSEQH